MKGKKTIVIRYIIMLLIFAVLTAGLVIFFSSREPVVYSAPLKPVEIARPELRIIESAIDTTGYIEASAIIPVVPFVQGTVEEYLIEPGMDVVKDEVIAVIDKRPYELQLAQAEAQFTAVESALKRTAPLYESGAATQQDYEMVKAQHDAAAQFHHIRVIGDQVGLLLGQPPHRGLGIVAGLAEGHLHHILTHTLSQSKKGSKHQCSHKNGQYGHNVPTFVFSEHPAVQCFDWMKYFSHSKAPPYCDTMRPSSIWITRSAMRAISGLWVIMTMVW